MKRLTKHLFLIMLTIYVCISSCLIVHADDEFFEINGDVYLFDKNSKYEIDKSEPVAGENKIGTISFSYDTEYTGVVGKDDYNAYSFGTNDKPKFQYSFDSSVLSVGESKWHIVSDSASSINEEKLGKKVESGAIVIQSSTDGEKWITDKVISNYFIEDNAGTNDIYETKEIQLENGCYYRIIVAYKMERVSSESKILFITKKNKEYKKVAEVYKFYFDYGEDEHLLSINDEPRMELGSKVNTGKDNGYSLNKPIDIDDVHYGWDLGTFVVNGYTSRVDDEQTPVFLKNVGDKITLWFSLEQDINNLNGNANLVIADDVNGYDKEFEIPKTGFGHGTLIIEYTDSQNHKHDPVVYTNFLEANITTTANTKVQLFEEGDYTVKLDYEIKSDSMKIGELSILPGTNDYSISFSFKVRNSNCMVYPMDLSTGRELSDYSLTKNGFKLDLANSKYLTINVKKSEIIKVKSDGTLKIDDRSNKVSKNDATFDEEGIYTFTVKNEYTGEEITKTIFVGSSKYLKALSLNNLTVKELNEKIESGYEVQNDGKLK